jgi:hypothetical protein
VKGQKLLDIEEMAVYQYLDLLVELGHPATHTTLRDIANYIYRKPLTREQALREHAKRWLLAARWDDGLTPSRGVRCQ